MQWQQRWTRQTESKPCGLTTVLLRKNCHWDRKDRWKNRSGPEQDPINRSDELLSGSACWNVYGNKMIGTREIFWITDEGIEKKEQGKKYSPWSWKIKRIIVVIVMEKGAERVWKWRWENHLFKVAVACLRRGINEA